jgi:SAM-dependent methyltransferase
VTRQLSRVRRIYDRDPARYHHSMALTELLLAGRRRKVGETARGRVLDVGFGTGLSLPFYPDGVVVIGIDASLEMLHFGRQAAAGSAQKLDVIAADAERLPFLDGTFDSVAFSLCLCTIPDPARAVAEAVRVARPGAPMAFLEHVRSHILPVALLQEALNPPLVYLQEDHWNRRTAETVRHAGVEIESVDRWLLGFFNLIIGRAPGRARPKGALA